MHSPEAFRSVFSRALPYSRYVETAKANERANWDKIYNSTQLSETQVSLVRSFARRVNVLVVSGTWCGDCVQQCPILARIAEASPAQAGSDTSVGVDVRFIDRDVEAEFVKPFTICGGQRVPTAIWLNEDFEFLSLLGDRTLTRYRGMAARQLGPSCPLPGAPLPADEKDAVIAEWLGECERAALMCRLSPRLRQKHND
jgi:hypothetical protein